MLSVEETFVYPFRKVSRTVLVGALATAAPTVHSRWTTGTADRSLLDVAT